MSFPRQGNNTLRSVHGIVEGWGGGWLEVLGGGGWLEVLGGGGGVVGSLGGEGGGGWLEVLGGRGGGLEVLAVRCDSATFVKTSQHPPPPSPPRKEF